MKKVLLIFILIGSVFLVSPAFSADFYHDGIYKDVGDLYNLNVYVQTYWNGGTILLYTFDTYYMYPFFGYIDSTEYYMGDSINTIDYPDLACDFDFTTNTIYMYYWDGSSWVLYDWYDCYLFEPI